MTGGGGVVVVPAPAKLTRTLRVTGVRDDGYHLIDAEMVTLDLADRLEIVAHTDRATPSTLTMSGPFTAGVPTDGSNLVLQALAAVGRSAAVHLHKDVPGGGGLGGGSADAAAVLRWAGVDDLAVAVRLGADVPFCLAGGRARVRGIGEVIDALPTVDLTVTLVVPPFGVSTPAVYSAWDRLGGPTAAGPNDLEPAALAVEPRLAWWRQRIGELTGATPVLAGSGATWFVEGRHDGALAVLSSAGATVLVARTVV
jgi:4-diphosphocytidyl-2-C-methyl-D-erythritol kinase